MAAYDSEVWGRWNSRNPFGLDPAKPRGRQIASVVGQFGLIFGGPLLGLVAIAHYPPLVLDSAIYIGGLGSIVFWFAASFAMFGQRSFPRGTPLAVQLVFRVAFGMCTTGLAIGVLGIINGYGTPIVARDAAVVGKRQTLEHDPANRTNYLMVRAWPGSAAVVELAAPVSFYDRLDVPVTDLGASEQALEAMPDAGAVHLGVGEGRLGVEWFAGLSPG